MLKHVSEFLSFLRLNKLYCIYTTHFIHLFVDAHLDCKILAAVNNAAGTQVYRYLFETLLSINLDIYPEVELFDHIVNLFILFFLGTTILFYNSYIILHSFQQCTRFLISSHPYQHVFSFCSSHPNECEVISHCSFELHFSND
uniref:Uncharacterized protein n=1 Tax=Pipistrellus kuhlii TaxID=59472 RepID=A0A7J7XB15_PIPKU|nr:hypothetical protein mPipKuh1_010609 [Pipistrellus kuhlii]